MAAGATPTSIVPASARESRSVDADHRHHAGVVGRIFLAWGGPTRSDERLDGSAVLFDVALEPLE